MFQHRSQQQKIFAILMLLSLLFQVQTVFACQMMGTTVAVEDCCCDEGMPQEGTSDRKMGDSCCEFSPELKLKEPGTNRELPAIVQAPPDFELPDHVPFLLLAAIWPEELSTSDSRVKWIATPQSTPSGTKIYLSTQRLRI